MYKDVRLQILYSYFCGTLIDDPSSYGKMNRYIDELFDKRTKIEEFTLDTDTNTDTFETYLRSIGVTILNGTYTFDIIES
jgi:hypothetical protein